MLISLIIPIHNAKNTLNRCVDSILKQTFFKNHPSQLEILLINNNSTDNSSKIIQTLHQKHPKIIKVHDFSPPGASAVRNFGAQKAKGKYLWFIDADDYIDPTAIEKLLTAAETPDPQTKHTADLTLFSAQRHYNHRPGSILPALDPKAKDFKSRFVRYGFGPWQFLIRRDWWLKNHLTFPEGIIHEDMALMSALILYTNHFAVVPSPPLYHYLENPHSVLHKTAKTASCLDIFPALEHLYQKFTSKNAEQIFYSELEYFYIWNLLLDSARDFKAYQNGRLGFRKTRQTFKQRFPNWRQNPFFRQKSLLFRLRCHLAYYGLVL